VGFLPDRHHDHRFAVAIDIIEDAKIPNS